MSTKLLTPELLLPWSSSAKEDKVYRVLLIVCLAILFIGGIWVQNQTVPKIERRDIKPPSKIAKLIEKKKEIEKPKPVIEKKPEIKVAEKEPEKKEPEKEKEPEKVVEKPRPVPVKDLIEQKAIEVKQAREKAKKSGLLAMQDDLASMRTAFVPNNKPGAAGGGLSKAGAQGVGVSRNVLMGSGTGTSGGIRTAALPGTSGVGIGDGGGGGGGLGRDVTQVDAVTLGGKVVDTGGDVEKAIASKGKTGNRSEELIRSVLDQNKGALYAIYNRALREDPSLQGKVTFELVIEPDGSVSSCTIVNSELNDEELGKKLISRMKLINFGDEDATQTKTRWAIDFLPY